MSPLPHPLLFDTLVAEIKAEYARLEHTLGWRFLNVSSNVMNGTKRVALITLNPGGDHIPEDHPDASCENGASYLVEQWGDAAPGQSTLQLQVQLLFAELATKLRYSGTPNQLLESSLVSQFIPFRSPNFEQLPRRQESITFARTLWSRVLAATKPRLIVCLSREVERELIGLIPECLGARRVESIPLPTGWGNYNAETTTFKQSSQTLRLLYLPHLSTWKLFTSQKCRAFMPAIIHAAVGDE